MPKNGGLNVQDMKLEKARKEKDMKYKIQAVATSRKRESTTT